MYQIDDTIAAIATPSGQGAIGIVRLSGEKAFFLASCLFPSLDPLNKERKLHFGPYRDPSSGELLDQGLLLAMPGPKSYTGEDVVELHVHGSPSLLSLLMEALVKSGARPADPGEFTYRAFMRGRLDLAQAEAVEALVSAQGEASRRQALGQLTGGLSAHLEPLEESLKSLYLKVEARLEFSEDGIPPLDLPKFLKEVEGVHRDLGRLDESYRQGKVLREGLKVALVGPPNTGKSSLLNALLGISRAIVTPVAGTTRDVVEGEFFLNGMKVRLFDTAGLRETQDPIEQEGVKRSHQVIEEADLLFWLVDASSPEVSLRALRASGLSGERVRILLNKKDLVPNLFVPIEGWDPCAVSCLTGEGLSEVRTLLEGFLSRPSGSQEVVLTSLRHKQEIEEALRCLDRLKGLVETHRSFELWAEELKGAALAIGRIRGRNLPAAAFEDIFTKFCIGK